MTLNWATQVSFEPKLLAIGVEKTALTHELIAEGGVFSLSMIDREDRAIVRKFTKPVEVDAEASTLNGFPFRDGAHRRADPGPGGGLRRLRGPPDRRLRRPHLFLGEVVDAGFTKAEDTPVLRMEDTRMSYGG